MTVEEMLRAEQELPSPRVRVQASDYSYDGWLAGVVEKRSKQWRAVVEDSNGRLFIHNAGQLSLIRGNRVRR